VLRSTVAAVRAAGEGDWAGAARALVAAGEAEESARRLPQAAQLYRRALELGRKPRDRRAEGLAWRRLGRVLRLSGRLDDAATHYRRGLEVADAEGDLEGVVIAAQGLGNVAVDRGLWDEAGRWYEDGLAKLDGASPSLLHWQLCNNLAVAALRSGRLDESEAWLRRAEQLGAALGAEASPAIVENNRGRLHAARGDDAAAETSYRRALDAVEGGFTRCRLLVNLAETLLRRGAVTEAEAAARRAEAAAIEYRLAQPLADAYRVLGQIARHRGDAEGFLFFEQALDLCREYALPEVEYAATQYEYGLSEAALGLGESARARFERAREIFQRLGSLAEVQRASEALARLSGAQDLTDDHPVPE
jgi:tetratricopeptide (TPR) repeat protein